jgi:carbon starvation protein
MKKVIAVLVWLVIALAGACAYVVLATSRGEHLNSVYILIAALSSYAIGYRFYSKWIATRVLMLDELRATPCEVHDDGKDFVKTNRWIVFGHHFAAISGPGPLVGPVLAAQFGYLPSILWILIGVVLGGAVQDFVILFCSLRRDGKSLGQMVKEELNSTAGALALVAILAIMTILLAVLALVVVRALADSPWGVFTVGSTIPIAMFMGGYLRFWRVGKVLEATAIGVTLLLLAVWGGKMVYGNPDWSKAFGLDAATLAWSIIVYGLAASVLPVWLLLAPRDYLSTFMKLGTIFALAVGIFVVLPSLKMPALSRFIDGTGPVVPGKLFPFCFITIACGAISGFHALIASGTTPKLLTREGYARSVGYGAMCFESLVATMALVAACTLEPGVYLSVNIKGPADATVAQVTSLGFPVTTAEMDQLAQTVGEKSLFGRTGGAATLAVGMANIFSKFVNGHGLDLWYHFAIMFEALFILTTLDAGTRVGRYILQDALGHVWKPLGETRRLSANLVASLLMVSGWGYFLIQGVRDPLGGVSSLWHLFGIANQLLSVVALSLATTIILKMHLSPPGSSSLKQAVPRPGKPAYALIALIPLLWLLAVTTSAGYQKICSGDPQIGFLAKVRELKAKFPALELAVRTAQAAGDSQALATAQKALSDNRSWQFNWQLDAAVAGTFLVLVVLVVAMSAREWVLLLARRRLATLHETNPVWLPKYTLAAEKPLRLFQLFALALALARELSGEAEMERTQKAVQLQAEVSRPALPSTAVCCANHDSKLNPKGIHPRNDQERRAAVSLYLRVTERRFQGVRRCC